MDYILDGFHVLALKAKLQDPKNAPFKIRAYDNAINILKSYDNEKLEIELIKAHFEERGKKHPAKLLKKIEEYIKDKQIEEVEDAKKDPQVQSYINLEPIYGIGPKKAIELYEKHKIITVDDLKAAYKTDSSILNDKQAIGLEYHGDLMKRIPRKEIQQYERELLKIARKISSDILFSINGSYRRKKPTSGDIDILISSKTPVKDFRKQFIDKLKELDIIKATLAQGKKKFMGIAALGNVISIKYQTKDGKRIKKVVSTNYNTARHVDIIESEPEHFAFGQLYFTGSMEFNAKMRKHALDVGYTLNEYELRHKSSKKSLTTKEIHDKIGKDLFETEEDIFAFLDMEYVKPEDRK